tara:strand:+ start:104 stop:259 length:156 start_codon:yes stop_codon:yes gene_type:complete
LSFYSLILIETLTYRRVRESKNLFPFVKPWNFAFNYLAYSLMPGIAVRAGE